MSKHFTRKIGYAGAVAACAIMAAMPALAISLSDYAGLGSTAGEAGLRTNADIRVVIGRVIGSLIGLLGIIFVLLMVYGAFIWMTAQGSEEKIKKAKNVITSAVIGLVVVFASYTIASFVIDALSTATSDAPVAAPATPPPAP